MTKRKSRRRKKQKRKLLLIYALTVVFIGAMSVGLKSIDEEGGRPPIALQCNVEYSNSGFNIKNNDSFDYLKTKITVNDSSLEVGDVIAGETLFIPLDKSFINKNTASADVKKITLSCVLACGARGYLYIVRE